MKRTHNNNLGHDLNLKRIYLTRDSSKPTGLWYEIDGAWIDWCTMEDFQTHTHAYDLEIDVSKLLVIETIDNLESFNEEYKRQAGPGYYYGDIEWKKLKASYSGIEIRNYHSFSSVRFAAGNTWFYGWDCSSGCIWDLSIVKSVKIRKIEYSSQD